MDDVKMQQGPTAADYYADSYSHFGIHEVLVAIQTHTSTREKDMVPHGLIVDALSPPFRRPGVKHLNFLFVTTFAGDAQGRGTDTDLHERYFKKCASF